MSNLSPVNLSFQTNIRVSKMYISFWQSKTRSVCSLAAVSMHDLTILEATHRGVCALLNEQCYFFIGKSAVIEMEHKI